MWKPSGKPAPSHGLHGHDMSWDAPIYRIYLIWFECNVLSFDVRFCHDAAWICQCLGATRLKWTTAGATTLPRLTSARSLCGNRDESWWITASSSKMKRGMKIDEKVNVRSMLYRVIIEWHRLIILEHMSHNTVNTFVASPGSVSKSTGTSAQQLQWRTLQTSTVGKPHLVKPPVAVVDLTLETHQDVCYRLL